MQIAWYLGSFHTNYIIFRNVEIFRFYFFWKNKKIVKGNYGIFSGILFYLLKWKFSNFNLIIRQTCLQVAKVLITVITFEILIPKKKKFLKVQYFPSQFFFKILFIYLYFVWCEKFNISENNIISVVEAGQGSRVVDLNTKIWLSTMNMISTSPEFVLGLGWVRPLDWEPCQLRKIAAISFFKFGVRLGNFQPH